MQFPLGPGMWAEVAVCPVVSGWSAFLGVQLSSPQDLGAGTSNILSACSFLFLEELRAWEEIATRLK